MSKFAGQVVLVTGAARGQGRSHAVGFAAEGARVVAVDVCSDVEGLSYGMATKDDLETTAAAVRDAGGEIVTAVADVRSQAQIDAAVSAGLDAFGRLDHVIANAGVFTMAPTSWEMSEEQWATTLDINLSGVWRTCKAAIPALIEGGRGGSITMTSSTNGYRGEHGHPAYNASKLGLVALMRALAGELGEHRVRVNTIHPMTVKTPMMWNDGMVGLFMPGMTTATLDQDLWWDALATMNILPVGAIDAEDVTAVAMFLASDEGRYITASEIPIDGGYIRKVG